MTGNRKLFVDLTVATMAETQAAYGLIKDAAIAVSDGRIDWVGARSELPAPYADLARHPLDGRLVPPGLIDCHTHIVHGGDRAVEFEMRLNGASYEEVARAGGGIVSTVTATRAATEDELLRDARRRVDVLIAEGVTGIEIKSGYGLDIETELRMLRVARAVMANRAFRVMTSFLGAHATPTEYAGRDDAYIDEVCIPALRAAHGEGLVDAVDGFCEGIAFQPDQIARVFDVARDLGLPVKLHAEQLSNLGGARLAASYGALSADHIEYLDED
ncbi:MAG: imidazolonepropionase, partial [Roseovarius sp.]|nr:imidazolonepropionase [Roseovarius sp.]